MPAQPCEMIRTISADGSVAIRALVGTPLVAEAVRRHQTAPTASAALGRALMGSVLLAATTEDDETLQIQFRGNGPLGQMTAIADNLGQVRGYVHDPSAHPPARDGKLDVGRAVGEGVLAVVRYHPSWREPYTGIVSIVSGEVADDLVHYLRESEQTQAALAVGVFVDSNHDVEAAGGFLVQALPDASEETLGILESTISELPSTTDLVRAGASADDIVDRLLTGIGSSERHRSTPVFHCECDRDRILSAVVLLGATEVREIALQDEDLKVRCEFCAETYAIDPDEVGSLIQDA